MNERCFALKHNGECKELDVKRCPGCSACGFFKPIWMYERDRERAFRRISEMPMDKQTAIAHKYYGDKMPWKRSENE